MKKNAVQLSYVGSEFFIAYEDYSLDQVEFAGQMKGR